MQCSLIRQDRSCSAAQRNGGTMTRDGDKVCRDEQGGREL
jgi:hypothetical protein